MSIDPQSEAPPPGQPERSRAKYAFGFTIALVIVLLAAFGFAKLLGVDDDSSEDSDRVSVARPVTGTVERQFLDALASEGIVGTTPRDALSMCARFDRADSSPEYEAAMIYLANQQHGDGTLTTVDSAFIVRTAIKYFCPRHAN